MSELTTDNFIPRFAVSIFLAALGFLLVLTSLHFSNIPIYCLSFVLLGLTSGTMGIGLLFSINWGDIYENIK